MTANRWTVNCEHCGLPFEITLWSKETRFCTICEIEGRTDPDPGPRPPTGEDWPDTGIAPTPETEAERGQRYTREDHRHREDRGAR